VWFFAVLGLLAFLIGIDAWPFAQWMHALPLFDRALNDRLIAVVALAAAMLAAFAVDKASPRRIAIAALVAAVVYAVFAFCLRPVDVPRAIADIVPPAIAAAAIAFLRRDMAIPALLALIVMQRLIADASLLPVYPAPTAFPRLPVFQPLANVREPFRVTAKGSLLLPNLATMYGLEDVRSSTPVTFAAFAETYPLWLERRGFGEVNDLTRPMLSMMNVRFAFITTGDAIPAGWREIARDRSTLLIENTNVLPRAFIPHQVRFGRTPERELEEMKSETDFASTAWIDALQPSEVQNGRGTVIARQAPNGLHLHADMASDGYVVVSNSAWRGWRAAIDGHAVRPLRANHSFLAVHVPAGRHDVTLRFIPQAFVRGRAIAIVSLLGVTLTSLVRRRRVV
jgi:membrane protein YfhO